MSGVYRGRVEGDASLRLGVALCMRFPCCPARGLQLPPHPCPLSLSCIPPSSPHTFLLAHHLPLLVCDSTLSATHMHSGGQGGRQCGGEGAAPGQASGG